MVTDATAVSAALNGNSNSREHLSTLCPDFENQHVIEPYSTSEVIDSFDTR